MRAKFYAHISKMKQDHSIDLTEKLAEKDTAMEMPEKFVLDQLAELQKKKKTRRAARRNQTLNRTQLIADVQLPEVCQD